MDGAYYTVVAFMITDDISTLEVEDVQGKTKATWVSDPETLSPSVSGDAEIAIDPERSPDSLQLFARGESGAVICMHLKAVEVMRPAAGTQLRVWVGSGADVAGARDHCQDHRVRF